MGAAETFLTMLAEVLGAVETETPFFFSEGLPDRGLLALFLDTAAGGAAVDRPKKSTAAASASCSSSSSVSAVAGPAETAVYQIINVFRSAANSYAPSPKKSSTALSGSSSSACSSSSIWDFWVTLPLAATFSA